jgi:hypothetical protein
MLEVVNDELVVEEKGVYSIEKFLIARRLMYWQVYLHKTVVSAENMLIKVLQRAKILILNNQNIFTTQALEIFLKNNFYTNDFRKSAKLIENFSQLDDSDIYTCLKYWKNSNDFVLSNLSKRIINREILKIKTGTELVLEQEKEERIEYFSKENNCSKEEASFFVFSNKASNSTYSIKESNINILMKDGDIIDITAASDQFNIEALSKTVNKYFLCYPKD